MALRIPMSSILSWTAVAEECAILRMAERRDMVMIR